MRLTTLSVLQALGASAFTITSESQMAEGYPKVVRDFKAYQASPVKQEFLERVEKCAGSLLHNYYAIDVGKLGFVWMPVESRLWEFDFEDYAMTRCLEESSGDIDHHEVALEFSSNDIKRELDEHGNSIDSTNHIFFDLYIPDEEDLRELVARADSTSNLQLEVHQYDKKKCKGDPSAQITRNDDDTCWTKQGDASKSAKFFNRASKGKAKVCGYTHDDCKKGKKCFTLKPGHSRCYKKKFKSFKGTPKK